MTIKPEFMSNNISHPASGKEIQITSIEPTDYQYYFDNGYNFIFKKIIIAPENNDLPE